MGFSEPYKGISAGGLEPVHGVRPSDLELSFDGCADAVLTPPACSLVQGPGGGPSLEVTVGTFAPYVLPATDHSQVSRSADVSDVRHY